MKLSVCIDAVFHGQDFLESMTKVRDLGIEGFEFWSWWDKDLEAIARHQERVGLETVTFCTKMISLTDESKRDEYKKGLQESIDAAKRLKCKKLITQVGNEILGISRDIQKKSIIEGLKSCAAALESEGITLLVEPLNTLVDHKGYFLFSSDEAFEIIEEVGSSNVKVLFDIYHQQIMEGNLLARIIPHVGKIAHFHAAGNPGRHELETGEINYRNLFTAIRDSEYREYIGLEYFPTFEPIKGLKEVLQMASSQ